MTKTEQKERRKEKNSQFELQEPDDCPFQENYAYTDEAVVKKKDDDEHSIQTTGKFDDGECPICLVQPQVDRSFPPCGHTYCFKCLQKSSQHKKECPTCRMK